MNDPQTNQQPRALDAALVENAALAASVQLERAIAAVHESYSDDQPRVVAAVVLASAVNSASERIASAIDRLADAVEQAAPGRGMFGTLRRRLPEADRPSFFYR